MTARGPMIDGAIRPANPDYDPLAGHTPADYPFLQQAPERAPLPAVPPYEDYAGGSAQRLARGYARKRYGNELAEERREPWRLPVGGDDDPDAYNMLTNPIEALQEYGVHGGGAARWPSAFVYAVIYQLRQFNPGPALFGDALPGVSSGAMQMLGEGMPEAIENMPPLQWGVPPTEPTGNVHMPGTGYPEWWEVGIEDPNPRHLRDLDRGGGSLWPPPADYPAGD